MSPALLVAFSALLSISIADLSSEYAHHAVLDPAELLKLYWTVDWDKETKVSVEVCNSSFGSKISCHENTYIAWVKKVVTLRDILSWVCGLGQCSPK